MTILETYPDMKGGQLKFRVDDIDCLLFENPPTNGMPVDIYLEENGDLRGIPKNIGIETCIELALTIGRPKGFGVVMWTIGKFSKVMWTPYINDEGYFQNE